MPNASTMIGASAIRGIEFTAVMKGWKIALSRSERPRTSPAMKPLATPVTKPKNVFFNVTAAANLLARAGVIVSGTGTRLAGSGEE